MILLNDRMTVTSLLHQPNAKDLTKGMIKKEDQIETNNSTSLIEDLEMQDIFKNENEEERDSVITEVSQLLELVQVIATCAAKL